MDFCDVGGISVSHTYLFFQKNTEQPNRSSYTAISSKSWTDTTIVQALNDIKANEISVTKAAEKYGIPRGTLRDKLAKPPKRASYKTWSEDSLLQALSEIKAKVISINRAADKYGIPRSTLKDKLAGRSPLNTTHGSKPYLTKEEEEEIVQWAENMRQIGRRCTKEHILDIVESMLIKNPRPNPFLNNRPGVVWWKLFLKRNPSMSFIFADSLGDDQSPKSISCSQEEIVDWFQDFKSFVANKKECSTVPSDSDQLSNANATGCLSSQESEDNFLADVKAEEVCKIESEDHNQITVD